MPLAPVGKLPMSYEAKVALAAERAEVPPEDRTVPWTYWKRQRGALIAVAIAGLAVFFAPWVELHRPDEMILSGYDLARARGACSSAARSRLFIAALVLTRRTVYKMRGLP
jgi:hypothetical protein